ncbi:MAG: DUF1540 domain-containing protein [Clostridia bacterium]|nr:DUF1540 domain-containing protein [Clostridia bacterium]
MKDLKCGLKECKFNKGYSCCSKSITVAENTDCTTYSPDEAKRRVQFESASDFIPANYSVDTAVACSADCIYNENGKCRASGITVMTGNSNDAQCMTFVKE